MYSWRSRERAWVTVALPTRVMMRSPPAPRLWMAGPATVSVPPAAIWLLSLVTAPVSVMAPPDSILPGSEDRVRVSLTVSWTW
ncbi:hypothetical protein LMG6003_05945 [Achromobacter insolitus]|nr:hypothetical protein LMG6003_05945 [Achromobacter insolitus]